MNKNLIIGFNVVLAFAVALLFVLHFGKKADQPKPSKASPFMCQPRGACNIAYVNIDTLLIHYELYTKLKSQIDEKQGRSEGEYSRKMKQLETDYYNYQEKAQKGLLTRSQMDEHEMRLQQRQQELSQLNQKLSEELAREDQTMQKQIFDSIKSASEAFNFDGRYQVILNNFGGTSIIVANPSLNVTDSIITVLNKRYKLSSSK